MKEYYKTPAISAEASRDGWPYTGDLGKIAEDSFSTLWTERKGETPLSFRIRRAMEEKFRRNSLSIE